MITYWLVLGVVGFVGIWLGSAGILAARQTEQHVAQVLARIKDAR